MNNYWVCNTSPIIVLGQLNQLLLLEQIPDGLSIPPSVTGEVTSHTQQDSAAEIGFHLGEDFRDRVLLLANEK